MGLDRPIDITTDQRKTLLALLKRHLPNTTAWVYGSRVKWTARPQSDLDLVVFTTPDQEPRVSDLREAFEESNPPFRVDLFVWDAVPEQFRKQIEADHVVLVEREGRGAGDEWSTMSLREAGISLIDCDHRTPPAAEHGYPYVAIPQVKDGRINLNGVRHITREHFDEWTRKANPKSFDIVLSRRCNPGETGFVTEGLKFALGQNLVLLRSDGRKIFKPFLRWLVRGPQWWDQISKYINVGAVFDSLKCAEIPDFRLPIPPPSEQSAIAHILGTLDDKIELNRRMNETLEAMARALFKSWFIDFDPVRAKMACRDPGLPQHLADLFPDRLVDSELGPIPEGWEVKTIEDLAEVSSGKRPGVRYAETSDLAQVPLWGGNGPMGFVPEPLVEYPILLTGRVGTLGSVFRITSPCWPSDNTLILTVKDKRAFEFLFFQLKRIDFTSLNVGSTQPLVTQTNLKTQLLCFPPANVLERFHAFAEISYARLDKSDGESHTLAAMRDALLPKLVSGAVRVKTMEHVL